MSDSQELLSSDIEHIYWASKVSDDAVHVYPAYYDGTPKDDHALEYHCLCRPSREIHIGRILFIHRLMIA